MHKMLFCPFQGALINIIISWGEKNIAGWLSLSWDSKLSVWFSKHLLVAHTYEILWQVCPASFLGWPNASCEEFAQFDPCGHDNQMDVQVMFTSKPKFTGFKQR